MIEKKKQKGDIYYVTSLYEALTLFKPQKDKLITETLIENKVHCTQCATPLKVSYSSRGVEINDLNSFKQTIAHLKTIGT